MSKPSLTQEELQWIVNATQIADLKEAVLYYAGLMRAEGIPVSQMGKAVARIMAKEKKRLK